MNGLTRGWSTEWALHRAAEVGNVHRVMALVVEYKNSLASGETPAVRGPDEQEPKRLRTALMLAAWNGHVPVVEFLIRSGANCNIRDRNGRTALMLSMRLHKTQSNHMDVIRLLIDRSDCNVADNLGRVALHYAAKIGCKRAVEGTMVQTDSSDAVLRDNYRMTAVMAAAARGNVEVLMELYRGQMDINARDETNSTALMFAAIAGMTEIVHRLVELGVDHTLADTQGRTALMLAAARGHKDVVKLLVENLQWDFEQVDANGRSALLLASANGHLEVVKLLLINDPTVSETTRRKAAELARLSYHEHVEALLLSTIKDDKPDSDKVLEDKEISGESGKGKGSRGVAPRTQLARKLGKRVGEETSPQNQAAAFESSSRNWLLKWNKPFWVPGAEAIRTGAGANGQADLYDIIESMTGGMSNFKRVKMFDPECVFDPENPRVKEEILVMIGLYLHKEGYDSTSLTLQDEASIKLREAEALRKSALRVYECIVNGEWDSVKKLVKKEMLRKNYRKFLYAMYKQEYLEMIAREESSRAFQFLHKRLKPMEAEGKQEFPQLCYLLSCRSVTDAPLFRNWDQTAAREELAETFNTMFSLVLDNVTFSGSNAGRNNVDAERLVQLLQQAITYQIEFSEYHRRSGVTPMVQTLFQDFQSVGVPNRVHSTFVGHKYNVKCVEFIGDDGLFLASGSSDKSVLIWKTKENDTLEFDSDGEDEEYNDSFMENQDKTSLPECVIVGHNSRVWDLSSDKTGEWLASGAGDGTIRLWNVQSCLQESMKQQSLYTSTQESRNSQLPIYSQNVKFEDIKSQHEGDVYSLKFHNDQTHLLSAGYDKSARYIDLTSNKLVKAFHGHSGAVTHAVFNPLGNLVISGSKDCTIRFWDLLSGVCVRTFSQPIGEITSLDVGKSGHYILSASKDGSNRIWDLRMGKCVSRLRGHQNTTRNFIRAVYGPMDALVISGSEDGRVYIWDTQTGDLLQRLRGHKGPVFQAKWNETTSLVASCSDDGTLMTWAYR